MNDKLKYPKALHQHKRKHPTIYFTWEFSCCKLSTTWPPFAATIL